MIKPVIRKAILITLSLLLASCGGGGEDDRPRDTTSSINGVYSGSFLNDGDSSDLFAIIYQGLIFANSEEALTQYAGTAQGRDSDFFAIYGLFNEADGNFANAEAIGSFTAHENIEADYVTTEGEVGKITLDIDPVWSSSASLSVIAGSYTHTVGSYTLTLTIDENDGQLNGSDTDGCVFTGLVLPPESDRNIYIVDITQSAGCRGEPEEVDLLGYATMFAKKPDPDELFALLLAEETSSNEEFMLTLRLLRP